MRHNCVGFSFALASAILPRVCVVTMAAVFLAGCSAPKTIRTYEYLTDYERMTERFEPLASLVYFPHRAGLDGYQALAIEELEIGGELVRDAKGAKAYARLFRTLLANRLRERGVFAGVLLDPGPEFKPYEAGRALRMEGKVTVFSLGSGWKRYFSYWNPFLQGGASDFQIEARFRDAVTGEVIMELADRRRHLGNTAWGPNMRTFNAEFVMKHTVHLTARCLADFIAQVPGAPLLETGGNTAQGPEAPLLTKGGSTALATAGE